jgi:hypothetical protein
MFFMIDHWAGAGSSAPSSSEKGIFPESEGGPTENSPGDRTAAFKLLKRNGFLATARTSPAPQRSGHLKVFF